MVADHHPDSTTDGSHQGRDHEHAGKRVGNHPGDDGGGHKQRTDEQNSDDLHREEDRGGKHHHEQSFHSSNVDPTDIGDFWIEGGEKKLAIKPRDDAHRKHSDGRDCDHLESRDSENGSEKNGLNGALGSSKNVRQCEAERKGRGGDDANGGIGADLPAAGNPTYHERREQTPYSGAEVEVHAENCAGSSAAKDGVGEPMSDVAHAAKDDIDANEPADSSGKGGHHPAVAEELELKRFEQRHASPIGLSVTRSIPPCSRTFIGAP